jgi:Zn-dependent protease with chaperone function
VSLLVYSLVVLVAGPPVLHRLTHAGHAPRLGVAAWLAAIASVLVSWAAAAAFALVDLAHHWLHPAPAITVCLSILRDLAAGNAGAAIQLGLFAVAGMGAGALAIGGVRLRRRLVRMRARTHRHACAVHLVGRRMDGLDALVIDSDERAAYCIPGRPQAVVVTSAALATLSRRELAAILAHEHAHLNGHHPQIVALVRGLAAVFPHVRLMTDGARQVSRLLEMSADDAAVEKYGSGAILGGLLALAGAAPSAFGALGAADVAVLARAERIVAARRAGFVRMAVTSASIGVAVAGPVLLGAIGVFSCV